MKTTKICTAIVAAASLFITHLPVITAVSVEPGYSAMPVDGGENGIITTEDGKEWYKVNNFENGMDYIITVEDADGKQLLFTASDSQGSEYIWHYYRRTMVTSTTPEFTALSTDSFRLSSYDNELFTIYWKENDTVWDHYNSTLRYNDKDNYSYLKYDENADAVFSMTDDISEAAQVNIYTNGNTLERCIAEQPHAESYVTEGSGYSAPTFSVKLSDSDIDTERVTWYVDEKEYPCNTLEFTADDLIDKPAGVHRVSCLVEAHDSNNIHYREKSSNALFVIAKGVVPDSFITFSDVHEEYDLIGAAIKNVMDRTGGYIPALVLCTGDLVNGPTAGKDIMLSRYYPQIVSQLGGIDAVFVSGNHDSGEAAAIMSEAAHLSDSETIPPSGGNIFSGSSESVRNNGKSSQYDKNIKIYSINYDSEVSKTDNIYSFSYKNILGGVEEFLKKTAEDYHGELVIISAHSGLHVIGTTPPPSSSSLTLNKWYGENMYNVDCSYDLADIINSYAEKYNMNIMYLFGHDHSRQEEEIIMTRGETLESPVSYNYRTSDSLTLNFTYAHSGYLSTVIGCADANFSFIYRNGDNFSYDLIHLADNSVRHSDIASVYPHEANLTTSYTSTTGTVSSSSSNGTTVTTSAVKKTENNKNSPFTGVKTADNIIITGTALIILSGSIYIKRKADKKNKSSHE